MVRLMRNDDFCCDIAIIVIGRIVRPVSRTPIEPGGSGRLIERDTVLLVGRGLITARERELAVFSKPSLG